MSLYVYAYYAYYV
ncbi:hypothetical protein VTH06DRAFT_2745 [Thermothelomyces fergusii]